LSEQGIDVRYVRRVETPHLLRSRVFYLPDGRRTDRVDEARPFLPPDADRRMDLTTEYTDTGSPLHRRIWPIFTPSVASLPDTLPPGTHAHLAPGALPNNRANAVSLHARGVVTSLDWPWWDWDQDGTPDPELLANIDLLLPSLEELTQHAEARGLSPWEAAESLLECGPRAVAVKMGARGARVLRGPRQEWRSIPVYPTCVVDPTGAGDAFCGGFLVGWAETGDAVQAALYGTVSASFVIEGFGVQHALTAHPADARARLERMRVLAEHANA
jgi:ribokinase